MAPITSRDTTSVTESGCSSALSRTAFVPRSTPSFPPPWRTRTLPPPSLRVVLGFPCTHEGSLARCWTALGLSSRSLHLRPHCHNDLRQRPQRPRRLHRCCNRAATRGLLGTTGVPHSHLRRSLLRRIDGPPGLGTPRRAPLAKLPLCPKARSRTGLHRTRQLLRHTGGDPGTPTLTGTGSQPLPGGICRVHRPRRPPSGSEDG